MGLGMTRYKRDEFYFDKTYNIVQRALTGEVRCAGERSLGIGRFVPKPLGARMGAHPMFYLAKDDVLIIGCHRFPCLELFQRLCVAMGYEVEGYRGRRRRARLEYKMPAYLLMKAAGRRTLRFDSSYDLLYMTETGRAHGTVQCGIHTCPAMPLLLTLAGVLGYDVEE